MGNIRRDIEVERQGIALVRPLLMRWVRPGADLIDTNNARQSEVWQRTIGDFVMPMRDGSFSGVEVKTERRYTANFFVETWSNRAFGRSRVGWPYTLSADALVMVYLDVRAAFVLPMPRLYAWLFDFGNLYRHQHRERPVHRSADGEQSNNTCGVPVPFSELLKPVGGTCYRLLPDGWHQADLADVVPLPRVTS